MIMALESAAAAGVSSTLAILSQVLLLSANTNRTVAMESDKLGKTATMGSALKLMAAATVASSTVDTTVQETLAKDQSAHPSTPAGMPSMNLTMARGVSASPGCSPLC